jgi:hypothetical protein
MGGGGGAGFFGAGNSPALGQVSPFQAPGLSATVAFSLHRAEVAAATPENSETLGKARGLHQPA